MTVRATAAGCRARGRRTSRFIRAGFFLVAISLGTPAAADVGVTTSVFTDARFRGYSLSGGRPVAILDFAYDDPSGFYVDVAGTGVLRRGGDPAPLSAQITGGYAKRLSSGTTLDVGITHSTYSHYSGGTRGSSYTEIYAGIARGALSSRVFLSPHYFAAGRWTAYGEVNGSVSPARDWSIDGHVGMLVSLRSREAENYRPEFDWRIGVSRALGPVSLHAAWSAGAPGHDFYYQHRHSRSALVLGATLAW